MKKDLVKSAPLTLATKLYVIEEAIEKMEESKASLREELTEQMKKQGVKYVKLVNGVSYEITAGSKKLSIKQGKEEQANTWITRNNCWKLDTTKALQILRRDIKTPPFFQVSYGEDHLTIKRPKNVNN